MTTTENIMTTIDPVTQPATGRTARRAPLWIWLLVPIFATIAGSFATIWLALAHPDPVIAKDLNRLGKAVLDERGALDVAVRLGLGAEIELDRTAGRVRLTLSGAAAPATVQLRYIHPTRAELDRATVLTRGPDGIYHGALAMPDVRRGTWLLHDPGATWRLESEPREIEEHFTLTAPETAPPP